MTALDQKRATLREILSGLGGVLVAYSGGVDSAFLFWAALDALGEEGVLAVTASSSIYPQAELNAAKDLAHHLGARHRFVPGCQLDDPQFVENAPQRCYVCKLGILRRLLALAHEEGLAWVVEGSNVDDENDYRPGARAVRETGVRSPLQEAGLTKAEIRVLSRRAGLPTWNKPAGPCLATRFPYGSPITREGLARVGAAEAFLDAMGFEQLRVRDHGSVARIEVPPDQIDRLAQPALRRRVTDRLKELGCMYVALDLEGYRQGSLNEEVQRGSTVVD